MLKTLFVLLMNGELSRNFMLKAFDLGMANGEYAFIGVELMHSSGKANDFSWYKAGDNRNNRKAKKIYESFLSLAVRVPTSAEYALFSSKVLQRATDTLNDEASRNNNQASGITVNAINVGLTVSDGAL